MGTSADLSHIAFIGTGVMGSSMAGHLLDAGFSLSVYNRTKDKALPLIERGALWADSPAEAVQGADAVVSIVGYPSDVEEVYLSEGGVIDRAEAGALLIDMTTSSPELAIRIAERARTRGLLALDAPVSGGDIGARNATLTIMAGGSSEAFETARPIFEALGKSIVLQGGPGAGQHAKMANQIAIAGSMLAMVEMLAYAQANGLDREKALESVSAGSAASWSLQNLAPRILRSDFAPGFYVKHFLKDLRIAIGAADAAGISLPALDLAKRLYERSAEAGGAEYGTQALWLLYAEQAERDAAGVRSDAQAGGL
jgi:3-hydroxyisobutyrate dehydrogenase